MSDRYKCLGCGAQTQSGCTCGVIERPTDAQGHDGPCAWSHCASCVDTLKQERDQLRAELLTIKESFRQNIRSGAGLIYERDQLRAEMEELRRDRAFSESVDALNDRNYQAERAELWKAAAEAAEEYIGSTDISAQRTIRGKLAAARALEEKLEGGNDERDL